MTGKRLTVCIDIDNTLADYTGALREWIVAHGLRGGCELPDPDEYCLERASGWPFRNRGEWKACHDLAVEDGLYLLERPYEHAVDALRILHGEGFRIILATSRTDDRNGDTVRWVKRWRIPYDSILFGEKTDAAADVWLEDNPNTIRCLADAGRTVFHPHHEYCRHADGELFSWDILPQQLKRVRR